MPNGVQLIVPRYIVRDGGHIRKPSLDDVEYLTKNLRDADKNEIKAASGKEVEESIRHAVGLENSWVGVNKEGPWVIWGYNTFLKPEVGTVWCLATVQLYKHRPGFLRTSSAWLNSLCTKFKYLNCYADSRNKEHHRWLKVMKFRCIGNPLIFADPSVEFHEYIKKEV